MGLSDFTEAPTCRYGICQVPDYPSTTDKLEISGDEAKAYQSWCAVSGDKKETIEFVVTVGNNIIESLGPKINAQTTTEEGKTEENEKDKKPLLSREDVQMGKALLTYITKLSGSADLWCQVSTDVFGSGGSQQMSIPLTKNFWDGTVEFSGASLAATLKFCELHKMWVEDSMQIYLGRAIPGIIYSIAQAYDVDNLSEEDYAEFDEQLNRCSESFRIAYDPEAGLYSYYADPKYTCCKALQIAAPDEVDCKPSSREIDDDFVAPWERQKDKALKPWPMIESIMDYYLRKVPWPMWVEKELYCRSIVDMDPSAKLGLKVATGVKNFVWNLKTLFGAAGGLVYVILIRSGAVALGESVGIWQAIRIIFSPSKKFGLGHAFKGLKKWWDSGKTKAFGNKPKAGRGVDDIDGPGGAADGLKEAEGHKEPAPNGPRSSPSLKMTDPIPALRPMPIEEPGWGTVVIAGALGALAYVLTRLPTPYTKAAGAVAGGAVILIAAPRSSYANEVYYNPERTEEEVDAECDDIYEMVLCYINPFCADCTHSHD
jgi:hypothetical protein